MSDKEASSRIEQRSVIKFLAAEGCKAVEIHSRMSTVYGATCFNRKIFTSRLNCLKKDGEVLRSMLSDPCWTTEKSMLSDPRER